MHGADWGGAVGAFCHWKKQEFRRTYPGSSRIPLLTPPPSPGRNQKQGSKAEQAKGLPDRKLVAGFAFIAQGNGYKYTRKSNYDSANRMGQDLSLSSNHSIRDKHGFILSYQLELSTTVPDH